MLTHGNFMFELGVAVDELERLFEAEGASTLLFLPLAHVFAGSSRSARSSRAPGWATAPTSRTCSTTSRSSAHLHPRGAPRLREGLQHRLAEGGRRRPRRDLRQGRRDRHRLLPAASTGAARRWRQGPPRRLLPARLRQAARRLGGECTHAVSGGAPLGERLGHFYRGIGLTVLEGYGLTETTAALTVNLPDAAKIGTVGRPLPARPCAWPTTASCSSVAARCSPATGATRPPPPSRSSATAGSTPATSARSTTRASCGSPGARRRSW